MSLSKFRVASLFCGCGGTDIGLQGGFFFLGRFYEKLNTEVVFANDFDANACRIFDLNFDTPSICGDITQIQSCSVPDHDILTGGFPCQSFSIVAQNPPRLGIRDKKGELFFEMCRILREKSPRAFIAENVKGIYSANNGNAFPLIVKEFESSGYYVTHFLLNAFDYGIPQKRERVFIVGFRDLKDFKRFWPPAPVAYRSKLKDVIFAEESIEEKYYFSEKAVAGLMNANKVMNKGRAQNIEGPCATVGAHLAKISLNSTDPVLKINDRYRRFTPREVARIQSFPDTFVLSGSEASQYRALGNAIPPVLAWFVGKSVIDAFE